MSKLQPGSILLLGSGETAPAVQRVYQGFFEYLGEQPRIAILETPAGFEPNSQGVAEDIASFIQQRLPNFKPRVQILPARRRDGELSTNNPELLVPQLTANVVLTGPGSPTYAIQHLRDSICWDYMRVCNRLGQHLFLSSAATVAAGALSLPVYEIYKVGMDLYWQEGLSLFGDFGLNLTVIPHWNNTSGGAALDTTRCYMGLERFSRLLDLLPAGPEPAVLGIDENTAVHIQPSQGIFAVLGRGQATLLRSGTESVYKAGKAFSLYELGDWNLPELSAKIGADRTKACLDQREAAQAQQAASLKPPPQVQQMLEARALARKAKSWSLSDELRASIRESGWDVQDSPSGQLASPLQE